MKNLLAILTLLLSFNAYAKKPTFEQHLQSLKTELTVKGYDSTILDQLYKQEKPKVNKKIATFFKNQPEVKSTFDKYLKGKLSDWRIKTGAKKYDKHKDFITTLEQKYGVPGSIIIALWGVETNYGTYPLKHNAIKALVNLSYIHPRESRRKFFKNELFDAFEVIKRFNFDPTTLSGSWAGALGQSQFMPSNVLRYAVDGNNDGKIDIWNDEQDVLASAANFISHLGWKTGLQGFKQINVPAKFNILQKRQYKSVSQWQKEGINFTYKYPILNENQKFKLFAPQNNKNSVYLISKNFDVIKRWNNSDYFAFSVLKLAAKIRNYK